MMTVATCLKTERMSSKNGNSDKSKYASPNAMLVPNAFRTMLDHARNACNIVCNKTEASAVSLLYPKWCITC